MWRTIRVTAEERVGDRVSASPSTQKHDDLARLVDEIVRIAHPLRIVLFGSFARQGADQARDIDLLVVVTEGTNRRSTSSRLYGEIRGVRTPFDVVVATPSDLEGRRGEDGLVYADIARDGREVYAA